MGKKSPAVPPVAPVTAEFPAQPASAAADASAAAAAKASKGEPNTVKFRDHGGEPTERTFSKEVHGDDFAKLAAEFKETNASRIIA
jgi:hypothetical protein